MLLTEVADVNKARVLYCMEGRVESFDLQLLNFGVCVCVCVCVSDRRGPQSSPWLPEWYQEMIADRCNYGWLIAKSWNSFNHFPISDCTDGLHLL